MQLKYKNILVSGAAGGIGTALSRQLSVRGANLALHGLGQDELDTLLEALEPGDNTVQTIALDLTGAGAGSKLVEQARARLGGLDMVINLAGIQTFKALNDLTAAEIDQQLTLNLGVPIYITQAAARVFEQQGSGSVVNIGSTFGSIGFAQFSVYSASKFGLRGFTEAMRRELHGTGVEMLYIAPRATQTALNSSAVYAMAEKTGMTMDSPQSVAEHIVRAIEKHRKNTFIGFPETFFCKLNALFPGLVDKGLARQNTLARDYAKVVKEGSE